MKGSLEQSPALWNRTALDLRSEEIIAQILDYGELQDWRELYALAEHDTALRERMARVVRRVPLAYRPFWVAALRTLGEPISFDTPDPSQRGGLTPSPPPAV